MVRLARLMWLGVVLVLACSGPRSSPAPMPHGGGDGGGVGPADAGAATAPAPADAAAPAPKALAADGFPCKAGADCKSGVCEGPGCPGLEGVCVARDRMCAAMMSTFCGCDGDTFQAGSSCPNRRYAYTGACTAASAWKKGKAPDYAPCLRGDQCRSGICEGKGCGADQPGTCQPATRGCAQMAVQYCGCDGKTFTSSACAGRRYQSRGPCPAP